MKTHTKKQLRYRWPIWVLALWMPVVLLASCTPQGSPEPTPTIQSAATDEVTSDAATAGATAGATARQNGAANAVSEMVPETVTADNNPSICPIPPIGYETIPGYQPGQVEPDLSQTALQILSPTVGTSRTHFANVRRPIHFCGVATGEIVTVKLFSTGAYIYEELYPDPAEPELPIGEATVENGIWFVSYDAWDSVGKRLVIVKGYDADNQLIETTNGLVLELAFGNPG